MSRDITFVLILFVPLLPVWILYKYLKQGLHEASVATQHWKFTGPAALYLVLVLLGFKYLLPPAAPPKPTFSVTAQLWPRPDISVDFLKAKEARLYVTYASTQEPFTEFVTTPDFLEQTKDVDASLKDKPVELRVAPQAKYRAEPSTLYLTGLLRVNVVPASAPAAPASVNTTIDGKSFLATTWVPILKNLSQVSATLDENHRSVEWASGKSNLISLDGSHFSGSQFSLDDKLEIVDASGAPVKGAWVGNELGAANGKPIAVSTDGKMLKAYASLPSGATGNYFLRVMKPDGKQYSIPAVVAPARGGAGVLREHPAETPTIEPDVHETLVSSRLAQGWTLHRRGDLWSIYFIVDTDQLSRPMIDALDQREMSLDKELTEKVSALWSDIHSKVPSPKALRTEYGEIKGQEFVEHLVHYRTKNPNTATWNYEVFQIKNGIRTGITPPSAQIIDIPLSNLSTKSHGTITELDALAVHTVNRRYVDAMVKISK